MEPLKIYIPLLFAGFCQQIFQKKNISEGILGKNDQNLLRQLADFRHQGGGVLGKSIKKNWDENLFQIMLNEIIKSCKK